MPTCTRWPPTPPELDERSTAASRSSCNASTPSPNPDAMKKKIIIGLVVVLAIGGYVAKSMLLKPKVVIPKVNGTIYVLPHQFTLNMADGRYATLTAALLLAPGQSDGATADGTA